MGEGIYKYKARLKEFKYKPKIEELQKALREDEGLYYGYQANIAMAFKDEFARCKKQYKNKEDIHLIANNAAKNFLNLLIEESK
jgi:ferredoxin-NADP reductase